MKQLKKLALASAVAALSLGGSAMAEDVIRFATWDSDESLAIQQEIAKRFEAANPGVKVQVEPYADGYDKKTHRGIWCR